MTIPIGWSVAVSKTSPRIFLEHSIRTRDRDVHLPFCRFWIAPIQRSGYDANCNQLQLQFCSNCSWKIWKTHNACEHKTNQHFFVWTWTNDNIYATSVFFVCSKSSVLCPITCSPLRTSGHTKRPVYVQLNVSHSIRFWPRSGLVGYLQKVDSVLHLLLITFFYPYPLVE